MQNEWSGMKWNKINENEIKENWKTAYRNVKQKQSKNNVSTCCLSFKLFAFQLLIKNIFSSEVVFVLHVNFVIKILLIELKHNLI